MIYKFTIMIRSSRYLATLCQLFAIIVVIVKPLTHANVNRNAKSIPDAF